MPERHPLVEAARAIEIETMKPHILRAVLSRDFWDKMDAMQIARGSLPTRTAAENAIAELIRAALTGDTTAAETKLLAMIPTMDAKS